MRYIPLPPSQCKLDRLSDAKSPAYMPTLPRGVLGWPGKLAFLHNRPKSYPVSPDLCQGHPVSGPSNNTPIDPKLLRYALPTSHQTRVASRGDSPSASASSRWILYCNVTPIPDGPELPLLASNPTNRSHTALHPSSTTPQSIVGFGALKSQLKRSQGAYFVIFLQSTHQKRKESSDSR